MKGIVFLLILAVVLSTAYIAGAEQASKNEDIKALERQLKKEPNNTTLLATLGKAYLDTGDFVVIVNAEKIAVTSDKSQSKIYYRHSGYPGGLRAESFESLRERRPEAIIERAVRGMLPKNRLGRQMLRKLKVHAGPDHPHRAQSPQPLDLKIRKVDS